MSEKITSPERQSIETTYTIFRERWLEVSGTGAKVHFRIWSKISNLHFEMNNNDLPLFEATSALLSVSLTCSCLTSAALLLSPCRRSWKVARLIVLLWTCWKQIGALLFLSLRTLIHSFTSWQMLWWLTDTAEVYFDIYIYIPEFKKDIYETRSQTHQTPAENQ